MTWQQTDLKRAIEIRRYADECADRVTDDGHINTVHVAIEQSMRTKYRLPSHIPELDGPGRYYPRPDGTLPMPGDDAEITVPANDRTLEEVARLLYPDAERISAPAEENHMSDTHGAMTQKGSPAIEGAAATRPRPMFEYGDHPIEPDDLQHDVDALVFSGDRDLVDYMRDHTLAEVHSAIRALDAAADEHDRRARVIRVSNAALVEHVHAVAAVLDSIPKNVSPGR